MKWRTARKRQKRRFWKRKGHAHLYINRGIWLRDDIYPEFAGIGLMANGDIGPRWYRKYP